mmetsp:Transcript_44694/g.87554  ORF Transcript_44694/g.87554 Transcript_44694/m.87554 type:complete len:155 (-) Transcript_44694:144-608(-)
MSSVIVRNRQKVFRVNTPLLRLQIDRILHHVGCRDFGVYVFLIENKKMKDLNGRTRGFKKSTDVLSFPFQRIPAGETPQEIFGIKNLGSMYISVPYVKVHCRNTGKCEKKEMAFMAVHGILHMLGYDHMNDAEEAAMQAEERKLMHSLASDGLV